MRVLAVLAHDNPKSLNASIFNKMVVYLEKKGFDVDVLDLYQHADEIPFYYTDRKKLEANSFYQDNKKLFMNADRLVIVFPVYWYSTPGILKCWIDLITNYAWKFEGFTKASALHKITSAFVVNTSLAPVWFRRIITSDVSCKQLCNFFKWIGIKRSYFYRIGITNKTTQQKAEDYLDEIYKNLDRAFK